MLEFILNTNETNNILKDHIPTLIILISCTQNDA